MNISRSAVSVVVPVWKDELNASEIRNVRITQKSLSQDDVVLLAPESLNVQFYEKMLGRVSVVRLDDGYFRDTKTYSRLMLSPTLYETLYEYCEVSLLCQTDAFITRAPSEIVTNFCWDYVGAPWVQPMRLNGFELSGNRLIRGSIGRLAPRKRLNVGNGGLSLRRNISFAHALRTYPVFKRAHHLNEDIVVSYMAAVGILSAPSIEEASSYFFEMGADVPSTVIVAGYHALERYYPAQYSEITSALLAD